MPDGLLQRSLETGAFSKFVELQAQNLNTPTAERILFERVTNDGSSFNVLQLAFRAQLVTGLLKSDEWQKRFRNFVVTELNQKPLSELMEHRQVICTTLDGMQPIGFQRLDLLDKSGTEKNLAFACFVGWSQRKIANFPSEAWRPLILEFTRSADRPIELRARWLMVKHFPDSDYVKKNGESLLSEMLDVLAIGNPDGYVQLEPISRIPSFPAEASRILAMKNKKVKIVKSDLIRFMATQRDRIAEFAPLLEKQYDQEENISFRHSLARAIANLNGKSTAPFTVNGWTFEKWLKIPQRRENG